MGRRSINTTKSGKYMNPTDQARKEARKKELKKNKKQRQMVRAAVLKGKDPAQLIEEMEKIDEMEYNVLQPSPLNEKVLREKRKKLKETFDRVMRLYHNDDIELWNELRRKEHEYEKRRAKRVQYFESVRTAQTVSIEDIPLPDMTETSTKTPQTQLPFSSVPMPPDFHPQIAPPNLKVPLPASVPKSNENQTVDSKRKEPPGCPPGQPPDLLTMRELDSDYESEDSEDSSRKYPISKRRRYSSDHSSSHSDDQNSASDNESDVPKPTSVQQRILAIAGQKYDDFMKELENVHKKDRNNGTSDDKPSKYQEESNDDSSNDGDNNNQSGNENQDKEKDRAMESNERPDQSQKRFIEPPRPENPMGIPNISSVPMPPPMMKLPPPMGMPPMFRPPPMRHGMPGHNPMGMRMPGSMMPRLRMPPGPPPGLPPRMMQHHNMHRPQQQNMMQQPPKDTKGMTTITAKPQIRNLSADVTRFVPSTLRIKREDKKPQKPKSFVSEYNRQQQSESAHAKGTTKDDAYMQFMREMQGLL